MGLKRKFSDDEAEETGVDTAAESSKPRKELPEGYVCNACGAIGQHAIYECPQKISKKKQKKAAAVEPSQNSQTNEETKSGDSSSNDPPTRPISESIAADNDQNSPKIKTVFLSGLPFDINKDRLLKAIESISDSVCNLSQRNITLLCFPDNPNRCKGIGYVNCENDDDFQRCLQLQGVTIGKMTISAQESKLPTKQPHHQAVASLGPNGGRVVGNKKEKGPPRCYRCGQLHDPTTCTNERICYKCRQPGHLSSQCPNKKQK